MSGNLYAQPQFRTLVFTRTAGWHHQSISTGVDAIKKLGQRHQFAVDWQDSPNLFTDENLAKYDVLIFLSTTGDVLNDEQQAAMESVLNEVEDNPGLLMQRKFLYQYRQNADQTEEDVLW